MSSQGLPTKLLSRHYSQLHHSFLPWGALHYFSIEANALQQTFPELNVKYERAVTTVNHVHSSFEDPGLVKYCLYYDISILEKYILVLDAPCKQGWTRSNQSRFHVQPIRYYLQLSSREVGSITRKLSSFHLLFRLCINFEHFLVEWCTIILYA